jgi:adenine specific DNA methylase Mod
MDIKDANAQKQAFADTWSNVSYMDELLMLAEMHKDLYDVLTAFSKAKSISDSAVAYLTTMAIRIYYMHQLLKDTGSFYLHCDPTMSHYLKLVCDMIFGEKNFRNEIVWKRTSAGKPIYRNFPKNADTVLYYTKTNKYTFYPLKEPLNEEDIKTFNSDDLDGKGKYNTQPIINPDDRPNLKYDYKDKNGKIWKAPTKGWRFNEERMGKLEDEGRLYMKGNTIREKYYLSERIEKGKQMSNIWIDIPIPTIKESLGYPTQKPEALMERIIEASTNEGDVVADFFCGCGTTISVAQKLNRQWLGADISHLAIRLIVKRLVDHYGEGIKHNLQIHGFSADVASARELAEKTDKGRILFQEWVIEVLLNGVANEKKVAYGGYDGYLTYQTPAVK